LTFALARERRLGKEAATSSIQTYKSRAQFGKSLISSTSVGDIYEANCT
jgi:hypothetical protein